MDHYVRASASKRNMNTIEFVEDIVLSSTQCKLIFLTYNLAKSLKRSLEQGLGIEVEEEEEDEEETFEVEKVLKKRTVDEYFVKWKGFPSSDNSWIQADKMDFTPSGFESETSDAEEFSEDDIPLKVDPLEYCTKMINKLKRKNQKLKKELNGFKKRKISK